MVAQKINGIILISFGLIFIFCFSSIVGTHFQEDSKNLAIIIGFLLISIGVLLLSL